ncbi:MAG: hypothetical protein AAFV93_09000 [Chloroflexota bacterium]
MLDETKTIKAKDIVEDPDAVYSLINAHVVLHDGVGFNGQFNHMMPAVEILFQAGWEVINFDTEAGALYCFLRNTNAKRKNG